jgi:hypothetical protein
LSTQVSGFGSSDNVIVRWTAVSGATSYKVYVGTSPGGEAATAAVTPTVAAASIPTQTGTYYYKVTAITAAGESARSAEVSATVLAAAPIPTNVVATPGNQQVTLTWTASPGAVRYDIARTMVNGAQADFSVTGTSFVDTGLVGGQTYLYLIGTANSQGRTSGQRTHASATPTGWTGVSLTAAPSMHIMNISFSAPPSMVPFPAGCNSTTTCAIGWRVSYGSRSGGETTSGSQFSSWIKSIGGVAITGAGSGTTVFAVVEAQIGGVWVRSAEASATMP